MLLLEKGPNEKLKNPKVEKADILETAVQFIRAQNQSLEPPPDERQIHQAGYHDCLQRAVFLLNTNQDIAPERKAFLGGYFASCLNQLPTSSLLHPPVASSLRTTVHGHLPETGTPLFGASSERQPDIFSSTENLPSHPNRFVELQASSQPSCAHHQSFQDGGLHTSRTFGPQTNNGLQALISAVWRPWP